MYDRSFKGTDLGVHTQLVPFGARTVLKIDPLFSRSKLIDAAWQRKVTLHSRQRPNSPSFRTI